MKKITVKDVRKLAMKYYNHGGDSVVECWDDQEIQAAIDNEGMTTERDWLSMFGAVSAVEADVAGY